MLVIHYDSLFNFFILFSIIIQASHGFLDFYINHDEVSRLIGLHSDIYYVKNGIVNEYALGFEMPINSNICDLNFTWFNLVDQKMPYSINLHIDNVHALGTTHMNISRQGFVPNEEQVFSIGLPCTGKEDVEVHVTININITVTDTNQRIFLSIRRNRICSKGLAHTISEDSFQKVTAPALSQPSIHSLTLALCFVLLFVLLFVIFFCFCNRMCQ